MIIESIVAGVTLITLGSLWVAKAIAASDEGFHEKDRVKAIEKTYEEKKRILERERVWWMGHFSSGSRSTSEDIVKATKRIEDIDQQLIDLAEQRVRAILRKSGGKET